MKLDRLELINFRCFRSEAIQFEKYTAFVGPNNSGKSTVFKAVDIFFRSTQKSNPLTVSDFNDPSEELRIVLTFDELPQKVVEEFSHYVRHGKLEFFIRAKIVEGRVQASIHGRRSGIRAFGAFHTAEGTTAQKAVYSETLRKEFPELPELASRAAVANYLDALNKYEAAHSDQQEMIESEDLAFGASGVASRLRKSLDWVYIPAVKDAAEEEEEAKNNAFGTLVNRIIRARVKIDEKVAAIRAIAHDKIKELVGDYREEVSKLQGVLDTEFRRLSSTDAHVHLDWSDMNESNVTLNMPLVKSIFQDDSFRGEISKFGHGLQRNYLMTLVHLNARLAIEGQPAIILAIEEPELYQHPPQARHLHGALGEIAKQEQVLITTHSPYFISAKTFETIRVIRKTPKKLSTVASWTTDQHRKLLADAFGERPIGEAAMLASLEPFIQPELNEAFFCGKLVLVEGLEDKAILTAALQYNGTWQEFVRCGGHIVGANGKGGFINMIGLAQGFQTPLFTVFDGDTNCGLGEKEKTKEQNSKLAKLLGKDTAKWSWPADDIMEADAIVWKDDIQVALHRDYPKWYDDVKAVCAACGWRYDRLKKNPAILSRTLESILGDGTKIASLDRAGAIILKFATD
jgi:predicted ATP-dependent endonuclease of OLD family